MSTQTFPPTGQEIGLGEDLASLACDAAIELDNLILDRSQNVGVVRKLAERLTKELPDAADLSSPKHFVNPSTVVVMSRVIRESSSAGQPQEVQELKEVQELTQAAGQIARRLLDVSDAPAKGRNNLSSLEQLRSFCLLLSKRAAAARSTGTETKPQQPYRKQG